MTKRIDEWLQCRGNVSNHKWYDDLFDGFHFRVFIFIFNFIFSKKYHLNDCHHERLSGGDIHLAKEPPCAPKQRCACTSSAPRKRGEHGVGGEVSEHLWRPKKESIGEQMLPQTLQTQQVGDNTTLKCQAMTNEQTQTESNGNEPWCSRVRNVQRPTGQRGRTRRQTERMWPSPRLTQARSKHSVHSSSLQHRNGWWRWRG
jgi:hypothetical protein